MRIEAQVTEHAVYDTVFLSVEMDREAALVLLGVFGAILGDPEGPRGVTSVLHSQLANSLQWNKGEGLAVHKRLPSEDVQQMHLVKSSAEMLRNLGKRRLSLWTNKDNPDEVATDWD
jgi:hypothetical protein